MQPFATRVLWPLLRRRRFERLAETARSFDNVATLFKLSLPTGQVSETTLGSWIEYGAQLERCASQLVAVHGYFEKLGALTRSRPIEELSRQQKLLTEKLTENSEALWQTWLRLQPSRLNQAQRRVLGDYSSILQLIASANAGNQQLGRETFRRYYQLFPQIASILPCWAVTSLSTRGRVPFVPNFFDLLVIDEASQCDIASALPLLFRARRAVVIGDPMQLRHISTLPKWQDQQLLSKHSLIDEYSGWAYSTRSLFDLASTLCRSEDIVSLRDHHRSHADIIEFSNAEFYGNSLGVATNYSWLRRPDKEGPAVRWIDTHGEVIRPGMGGAVNDKEARAIFEEVRRLVNQGYRGSIGVVSPFRAQANRIRDLVHADNDLWARAGDNDFLVDVVHKFQGDERDVVLFSPVVSSGISDGALRFLRNTSNLFNVAITRARSALIVVGDKAAASSCGVGHLTHFVTYVDRVETRLKPPNEHAETAYRHNYPAVTNPEKVSDWERFFYRALYKSGVRAIPQYNVEKYVLDFAVKCGGKWLDIEIDGERYHRNWDGDLCRRDQIRNHRLMELGWDVMRFWVYQIRDDLDGCIARVKRWMELNASSQ